MFSIDDVIEIAPPDIELSWERREFPSPDAAWVAVYHHPHEQHTGTMGWQISLIEAPGSLDRTPQSLLDASSGDGLVCPSDFMPWRCDSRSLVVLPWGSTPRLLDPESGKLTACEVVGTPLSAQWAVTKPYLMVVYFNRIRLLDGQGKRIAGMSWDPADDEIPYTGWTRDDTFFVLRQPGRHSRPRITVFDPEQPAAAGFTVEVDPDRLAPYDAAPYKRLARSGYTLLIDQGHRLVGALLDTWHQIRYDPAQGRLLLSVYRPVGPPFQPDVSAGEWLCEVEEKWVALPL